MAQFIELVNHQYGFLPEGKDDADMTSRNALPVEVTSDNLTCHVYEMRTVNGHTYKHLVGVHQYGITAGVSFEEAYQRLKAHVLDLFPDIWFDVNVRYMYCGNVDRDFD